MSILEDREQKKKEAESKLRSTAAMLLEELKNRGVDVPPFDLGDCSGKIKSPIMEAGSINILIIMETASFGAYTGDVYIKISGIFGYSKAQVYRRRKDKTFNWDAIAKKVVETRTAIVVWQAARDERERLRKVERANKQALGAVESLSCLPRRAVAAQQESDRYNVTPKIHGLTLDQVRGLDATLAAWAEKNGVEIE
jgi:hypothetical protein